MASPPIFVDTNQPKRKAIVQLVKSTSTPQTSSSSSSSSLVSTSTSIPVLVSNIVCNDNNNDDPTTDTSTATATATCTSKVSSTQKKRQRLMPVVLYHNDKKMKIAKECKRMTNNNTTTCTKYNTNTNGTEFYNNDDGRQSNNNSKNVPVTASSSSSSSSSLSSLVQVDVTLTIQQQQETSSSSLLLVDATTTTTPSETIEAQTTIQTMFDDCHVNDNDNDDELVGCTNDSVYVGIYPPSTSSTSYGTLQGMDKHRAAAAARRKRRTALLRRSKLAREQQQKQQSQQQRNEQRQQQQPWETRHGQQQKKQPPSNKKHNEHGYVKQAPDSINNSNQQKYCPIQPLPGKHANSTIFATSQQQQQQRDSTDSKNKNNSDCTSTDMLLVPATMAGLQEIALRFQFHSSNGVHNEKQKTILVAMPTECTYELVARVDTNNTIVRTVQCIQDYKWLMDNATVRKGSSSSSSSSGSSSNKNNNVNHLSCNRDIDGQYNDRKSKHNGGVDIKNRHHHEQNRRDSPTSIPELCNDDDSGKTKSSINNKNNNNHKNSTDIDYSILPTIPFLGGRNDRMPLSSSSKLLIIPHLYIDSVDTLHDSPLLKRLLPKKSYAIKLHYPLTTSKVGACTSSTNNNNNKSSIDDGVDESDDTTTTGSVNAPVTETRTTRAILATFNESIVVLQRLAKRYWPGPVKMYVAVSNDGKGTCNIEPNDSSIPDELSYLCVEEPHSYPCNRKDSGRSQTTTASSTKRYLALRCPSHPLALKVLEHCRQTNSTTVVCADDQMDNSKNVKQRQDNNVESLLVGLEMSMLGDQTRPMSSFNRHNRLQPHCGYDKCHYTTQSHFVTTSQQAVAVANRIEQHRQLSSQLYASRKSDTNQGRMMVNNNENDNGHCTLSAIMNGEDQFEIFSVPTCEYKEPCPTSIWIDAATRRITIRNNNRSTSVVSNDTTTTTSATTSVTKDYKFTTSRTIKLAVPTTPAPEIGTIDTETPFRARKRGFSIALSPNFVNDEGVDTSMNCNDDDFQSVGIITDIDNDKKKQLLYDQVPFSPASVVPSSTSYSDFALAAASNGTTSTAAVVGPSRNIDSSLCFPEISSEGVLNALHGFKPKSLKERVVKSVLMRWEVIDE